MTHLLAMVNPASIFPVGFYDDLHPDFRSRSDNKNKGDSSLCLSHIIH